VDLIIQLFAGGKDEWNATIRSMAHTIKSIHPMLESDAVGNSTHFSMFKKETFLVLKFMG